VRRPPAVGEREQAIEPFDVGRTEQGDRVFSKFKGVVTGRALFLVCDRRELHHLQG